MVMFGTHVLTAFGQNYNREHFYFHPGIEKQIDLILHEMPVFYLVLSLITVTHPNTATVRLSAKTITSLNLSFTFDFDLKPFIFITWYT